MFPFKSPFLQKTLYNPTYLLTSPPQSPSPIQYNTSFLLLLLLLLLLFLASFNNMKGDKTTPTKLISRYIKAPIRVLCKARDLYVRSLTDCSGMISYDAAMGCPAGVVYTLPTSFGVNSSMSREEEDLRALMLALSQKSTPEVVEASTIKNSRSKGLFKSSSVGVIGRIDEDKPCNFSDDFQVIDSDKVVFARNRSYAVSKKRQDLRKI